MTEETPYVIFTPGATSAFWGRHLIQPESVALQPVASLDSFYTDIAKQAGALIGCAECVLRVVPTCLLPEKP